MGMDCMIWEAMYGNGFHIGMRKIIIKNLKKIILEAHKRGRIRSFEVEVGIRVLCVKRFIIERAFLVAG
jgi:hypothetical protein